MSVADHKAAGCSGKKTYRFSRARSLAKEVGRRHEEAMQHYHCAFCNGWHIGRRATGKRRRGR